MRVDQGVVIVTGGASGLGAAVVESIVAAGGNVLVADIDEQRGEAQAAALGSAVRFCATDVTCEQHAEAAMVAAQDQFGAIVGLVCCAGIAPGEKIISKGVPHGLDSFRRAIEINLVGTFNFVRCAAGAMAASEPNADGERGVIVCTASAAAFDGQIGQAAYAASKAGIVGMTLPIARELAGKGIRVMTIAPGIFATPMLSGLPESVQQSLGQMVPFPARLGRPAEFARLVHAIFDNPMLNGEVIRLDGALRMAAK